MFENSTLSIPSKPKLNNSERILAAAEKTGTISSKGMTWVLEATDPFKHPSPAICGIPDQSIGNSVVCAVTGSLSIVKPGGLSAGNWACRIYNNPVASNCSTVNYNFISSTGVKTSDASVVMWPVQVDFAADGLPFSEFGDSNTTGLKIDDPYLQGPFKVAGLAFEACNTTSALNKQGTVTCAAMNQSGFDTATVDLYNDAVNWSPVSAFQVRTVPNTLAQMTLLPNNVSWEAGEGMYCVPQLLSIGEYPPAAIPKYPLWTDDEFNVISNANHPNWRSITLASAVFPVIGARYVPTKNPGFVPCNANIAMFTGLSEETTLTLRVRWIIERFPNDNEPSIVVLATPTAHFDPLALELYSRVMAKAPPAVMFKENDEGSWGDRIVSGLADILQTGLLSFPHPLAQGAGAAFAAARKAFNGDSSTINKDEKRIAELERMITELLKQKGLKSQTTVKSLPPIKNQPPLSKTTQKKLTQKPPSLPPKKKP